MLLSPIPSDCCILDVEGSVVFSAGAVPKVNVGLMGGLVSSEEDEPMDIVGALLPVAPNKNVAGFTATGASSGTVEAVVVWVTTAAVVIADKPPPCGGTTASEAIWT